MRKLSRLTTFSPVASGPTGTGFGGAPAGGAGGSGEERPHRSVTAQDAAISLAYADSVVIVPGYGLAVAQAQHAVKEMADVLAARGIRPATGWIA